MKVIADLHLHSKYSRAVSSKMVVGEIARWAKLKGIDLVGTGDWAHPVWVRELKSQLEEKGEGIYKIKVKSEKSKVKSDHEKLRVNEPLFLLVTELSSIYSQSGRTHKIHNLVLAPSFQTVEKINAELARRGVNLMADGRPITGISARDLAELIFSIDEKCLIIPAHVWTPHFSLYGSNSGFDSIEECFGDMSKYICAIETGLSCYDEKTEVLTDSGWKKFSEVGYADKICALNPKSEEIEYQSPRGIFAYQYKGKMYKLKTKRVDLLVTPNHKLLVSGCDFRKPPKFSLKEARVLFNRSKRFRKDGIWKGKNEKYFTLPAVKIKHGSRYYSGFRNKEAKRLSMKSWLKFFGFWLADGWTTQGKNGDYNVCLSNRDQKLLSEMKKILESFDCSVYYHRKSYTIRVRDYQLFHYLKQFGKAPDKFIPKDIKSLSKELLEILFGYYIKGDGHIYGRTGKGLSATTLSRRLRDDLQEIALKLGMSAYYRLGYKKGTPFHGAPYNRFAKTPPSRGGDVGKARFQASLSMDGKAVESFEKKTPSFQDGEAYKNRIYRQSEDSWIVYFIRKNIHAVLPSTIKKYNYIESWVNYDGSVYCLTVPNQIIYVRRGGISVWCGNSDPAMNWRVGELDGRQIVSFSDAHSGANLGREATVFRLKNQKPKTKNEKHKLKTKKISYHDIVGAIKRDQNSDWEVAHTIEFYPQEGKYHFTGHRNCGVKQSPEETKKLGKTCPVCGKPLTVGVMHRVEKLSNLEIKKLSGELTEVKDEYGVRWTGYKNRHPYVMLVPLAEILAEIKGVGKLSQSVLDEYLRLVGYFGSELKLLLETPVEEIAKIGGEKLAEGTKRVREGDIYIEPGYDGVYGKVKVWPSSANSAESADSAGKKEQMSLF